MPSMNIMFDLLADDIKQMHLHVAFLISKQKRISFYQTYQLERKSLFV